MEEALARLQSLVSHQPHPLLCEQPANDPSETETATAAYSESQSCDGLDALGTLAISDYGVSRYFGQSAGSEVCMSTSVCMTY